MALVSVDTIFEVFFLRKRKFSTETIKKEGVEEMELAA